jgi:hypothetical protein
MNADAKTIEAEDYMMDTQHGKLIFADHSNNQIAAYHIVAGAYVKKISK